jgi:hypothetical protein
VGQRRLIATLRTDRRAQFIGASLVVLLFNLFWYGRFLSFPLVGEDGAANYSFLLDNILRPNPFTTTFPMKWVEGLGQPNPFVTLTFDPFSWVMLLPLDLADTFRVSMALRATVCWIATYLFARSLFKSRSDIALLAATINMVVSFTLGHTRGVPTIAGIPNATHYAMFPLLLWAAYELVRERQWWGWRDTVFIGFFTLFLLTFPFSSAIGLAVLATFLAALFLVSKDKRGDARGLIKILAYAAVILFIPYIGIWHSWSAVLAASARSVFAEELYAYGKSYSPPHMWHDVPGAIRFIIIVSFVPLLAVRPWPRAMRAVALCLLLVVGGVQAWMKLQDHDVLGPLLLKLPRPYYLEFYTPVFYALAAAFGVRALSSLMPRSKNRWHTLVWVMSWGVFFMLVRGVLSEGGRVAGATLLGLLVAIVLVALSKSTEVFRTIRIPRLVLNICAGLFALCLPALAAAVWVRTPDAFHPMFAATCGKGGLWCNDEPGLRLGAAATPITRFIGVPLSATTAFRGRAETLLVPAPRFVIKPLSSEEWNLDLFENMKAWYAAALAGETLQASATQRGKPADQWRWADRDQLLHELTTMASAAELPESVAQEILAWTRTRQGAAGRVLVNDGKLAEVSIMVEERNRAYWRTGNGMMLRALPFQGIPVASSYEQALDYLYYLFWTRYINQGGANTYLRSINLTALERAYPDRLALIGVRYVVARESLFNAKPRLARVGQWSGYAVYEVPHANLRGYGISRLKFAKDLIEEVQEMRGAGFDPRNVAVLSEAYWNSLQHLQLAPVRSSSISIQGNELTFTAESSGSNSLVVLPFRYSTCLAPKWAEGSGEVVRADLALVGVLVKGRASVVLEWTGGYGAYECLRRDAQLVRQAKDAAERFE